MSIEVEAFDVSVPIARLPQAVWSALTDWERGPQWIGGGVERVDPPAAGTENLAAISFYARGEERVCSVQNCDPPHTLQLVSTRGGILATYQYDLARSEDGNTTIRLRVRVGATGLWRLVRGRVVKAIQAADREQLDRLRAYAEAWGPR